MSTSTATGFASIFEVGAFLKAKAEHYDALADKHALDMMPQDIVEDVLASSRQPLEDRIVRATLPEDFRPRNWRQIEAAIQGGQS